MKKIVLGLVLLVFGEVYGQEMMSSGVFKPKEVLKTEDLQVVQIAPNTFVHISYLQTNDFGKVACNGMIIRDSNEVMIFDTPTNNKSAVALIQYIQEVLHAKIVGIIPTHFHDDCLGGLAAFHEQHISSYGNFKTIELAKLNQAVYPQKGFQDSLKLNVGKSFASISYFGEGHTQDNVVGYFSKEKVLFGGCLIKETNATKGYLGDANVSEWSSTVEKVKRAYPHVQWVIPGHGKIGGIDLLDYTIKLFKKE